MKTVVHYISGTYLGRTETWIYSQIKELRQYRAIVYCHKIANRDLFPLPYIRALKQEDSFFERLNLYLNKLIHKIFGIYPSFMPHLLNDKAHIVHAHFGFAGYNFLKLMKITKRPIVTTFYGQDVNRLPLVYPKWKDRYKVLFEKGDGFLVEGNYMKKSLILLGCPENKIVVQRLGVDLEKIKFCVRRIKNGEPIKILIAGSFREKKGIPYALEAVGILKKENPVYNIKVSIIGDSSGEAREEVEKKKIHDVVNKYGMNDYVTFLGYQKYDFFIRELYEHQIFLSPSVTASDGDTEGGAPVSIIEASASGMPIISTNHCDIPEVVIQEETGFLVKERDSSSLKEALKHLIENPTLFNIIAFKARSHIEENYNLHKQVQKLEEVYNGFIWRQ